MRGIALAALGFLLSTLAYAATIHVTTTSDQIADTGTCSLREAIIAANTNAPSNAMAGECPSGNSGALDTVLSTAGTYALSRNGSDKTAMGSDPDLSLLASASPASKTSAKERGA
jgi:CSLREA domain-containing protein